MANLLTLPEGQLLALAAKLAAAGLPAEVGEACLEEDEETLRRRVHAFMNPPPEIEPPAPVQPPELLWRPVEGNPNAIEVNLAFSPKRPFQGAKVDWRWGPQTGWVLVEHKENALFVAGKKVAHHLEPEQAAGNSLQGHAIFLRLEAKMVGVVLHPNIKSAMMENRHLFPESWKVDGQGNRMFIYFFAVGFCNDRGYLYVESVSFRDGVWSEGYRSLDNHWIVNDSAAYVS